ncbi:efflux transporter outer membrane subunit [Bartonella raoultii]|uniref:Efflux transporter outer membrane subunit n=1 Tax=Bartonella raoultii TaxID=1457020 RepID=A0ABS7I4X8_9HYPH|nr:efflux transporter outer membrane subunit [Bartonella raoultii]MBX4335884.1 efflux transporter outer membrane subunit [Bartonella raoultii]
MQIRNRGWIAYKKLFYSIFVCFLMLSGCMVGPNYQKTFFRVPKKWGQQSTQTSGHPIALAGWWRHFNDPVLDALMNYAISGNNNVAIAKARIREARASLGQAVGTLLPSMSSGISGTRNGSPSSDETFVKQYTTQYRSSFDASWEVDFFGGHKRGVEAARYGLEAAVEDMRAIMVTLLGDVATNYVQLRGWQQKLLIVRKIALSQRKTYQLMRTKLTAGDASALDVSNAQAQLANTEADIAQMEVNLAMSIHRLSVLIGRVPTALQDLLQKDAKHAKIPQPKWPIPAGIPADILLTRPDLRRAERQYAQATARIGQREADRYPSLTLTGSISTAEEAISQLWKSSTIGWSLGPSIRFPFFNGGQIVASIEVARAQRDQAFITYRAAVLTALEEVENALLRLTKEHQRLEKLIVANRASLHSLQLSRDLFENGNTSFLELLNANRSYYSAQMALKDSRISLVTQYIALMKALGGGWDGVVDASRPEIVDVAHRSRIRVKQ